MTAQGGTPVYSYSQGLKALKAGKQITYIGASGPFYYNAHHNVYGPFVCVQPSCPASTRRWSRSPPCS